jgi:hypothetical protein
MPKRKTIDALNEIADELERIQDQNRRLQAEVAALDAENEALRARKPVVAAEPLRAGQPVYLNPDGTVSAKVTPETLGNLEAERDLWKSRFEALRAGVNAEKVPGRDALDAARKAAAHWENEAARLLSEVNRLCRPAPGPLTARPRDNGEARPNPAKKVLDEVWRALGHGGKPDTIGLIESIPAEVATIRADNADLRASFERLSHAKPDKADKQGKHLRAAGVALAGLADELDIDRDRKGGWIEAVETSIRSMVVTIDAQDAEIDKLRDRVEAADIRVRGDQQAAHDAGARLVEMRRELADFFTALVAKLGLKLDARRESLAVLTSRSLARTDEVCRDLHRLMSLRDDLQALVNNLQEAKKLQAESYKAADLTLRQILGIEVGVPLPEAIRTLMVDRGLATSELKRLRAEVERLEVERLGRDRVGETLDDLLRAVEAGSGNLDDSEEYEEVGDDDERLPTLDERVERLGLPIVPGAPARERVRAMVEELEDRRTFFAATTSLLHSKGVKWGPDALRNLVEEWDDLRTLRDNVGTMLAVHDRTSIPEILGAISRLVTDPERATATIAPRPRLYAWRFRQAEPPPRLPDEVIYCTVHGEDYVSARLALRRANRTTPGTWIHDPATEDEQARRGESEAALDEWGPVVIRPAD